MEEKDFSLFEASEKNNTADKRTADEIMKDLGREDYPEKGAKKKTSEFSASVVRVSMLIGALSFVLTVGCGTMLFYSVVAILNSTSTGGLLKFAAVGVLIGVLAAIAGIAMNTAVFIKNNKKEAKSNLICAAVSLVSMVSGILTLSNVLVFLKIIQTLASK